jgi:hypothetical protein
MPKPGPPVVSISTVRETPSVPGLGHVSSADAFMGNEATDASKANLSTHRIPMTVSRNKNN